MIIKGEWYMNKYLIPANTKKSQLILGFFTVIDLIIFGSGAFITFTLLFIFRNLDFQSAILVLLPVLCLQCVCRAECNPLEVLWHHICPCSEDS